MKNDLISKDYIKQMRGKAGTWTEKGLKLIAEFKGESIIPEPKLPKIKIPKGLLK